MTEESIAPIDTIDALCAEYAEDYFGRRLAPQEATSARDLMTRAHTQATRMMSDWSRDIRERAVYEIEDLVVITKIVREASNDLRVLKMLVTLASHLERQYRRLEESGQISDDELLSVQEAVANLSLIAETFVSDVASLQSHLSVTMIKSQTELMATQNSLAVQMHRAGKLTAVLTIAIVVLTLVLIVLAMVPILEG